MEKLLCTLYYDVKDPGSYGGVDRLYRRVKELGYKDITRDHVKAYLSDQYAYSLHRPARRRYKRCATVVGGIDSQWQADLCDMQQLSKHNDGYRYILTVIDILSKYAWAVPVKDKGGKTVTDAFATILSTGRSPKRLQTDKGKEFFNKEFAALLKVHGINHFASQSDLKAAVVERFNRTIKCRIWTYFTARRTYRWVDQLQDFILSYNNTVHRSTGMAPGNVTKADENRVWAHMYGNKMSALNKSIGTDIGDKVRLSKFKGIFEKGYLPNWTAEDFKVSKRLAGTRKRPLYKLQDNTGEDITGTFYPEEVQHIKDNKYYIQKIIKRRKLTDGTSQVLVKWEDWPDKFNSWINESEIQNGDYAK